MRLNKSSLQETSICSVSQSSKANLSEFPGFISINTTKDILYIKKSDNQISVFCLGPNFQLQELVMKVKTRREAMIASGYIPKQEGKFTDSKGKIMSIIPLTFVKGEKVNERVMIVMRDGFINIFELIPDTDPQGEEDMDDQGNDFNNNSLSISFSENLSNISQWENGNEFKNGNKPGHLMLDLLSRSRNKGREEKVLKAVVSSCNQYFLLSSFYIEDQKNTRGMNPYLKSNPENAKNFIWILRLYFLEEKGNLKFLAKTSLRLQKSNLLIICRYSFFDTSYSFDIKPRITQSGSICYNSR